jgi:TfoX/Sxy family transcriptional regulator of competence genes
MAYNEKLADRLREALMHLPNVEEKKMFSGLAFLVNDKMCINVSGDKLMCRFDPSLHETIAERRGYIPMIMKGKELKGYCYVTEEGFHSKKDFDYWVNLCLAYNKEARASKRTKPKSNK